MQSTLKINEVYQGFRQRVLEDVQNTTQIGQKYYDAESEHIDYFEAVVESLVLGESKFDVGQVMKNLV